MLLDDLAQASAAVSGTSSRLEKVRRIADCLRAADPDEVPLVVSYLAGELRQRRTGVGYAALRDLPPPADQPTLGVSEVDAAFAEISQVAGSGSQQRRRDLLTALWARATSAEQRLLAGLVTGELRQGALDGVMVDAVIRASELPAAQVRRAIMVAGAIAPVARAAVAGGGDVAVLDAFRLEVGRPLRPMLASSAPGVAEALDKLAGPAALEWKLDGIRVQVHRAGEVVRIFTRTLDDVTDRLPEVVATVRALPATSLVLDGEVLALDEARRPLPFQVTSSRVGSRTDTAQSRATVPLSAFFFDVLHHDGTDLLTASGAERWSVLESVLPDELVVPRMVTADAVEAGEFFADAVRRGHEGVVVKSLSAPYDAGRRGSAWIKVKPRHTLDLVVLAVEWGHGRRTGLLSNLHLGARDPETGGFVMLGKTFKGLTDELLRWQTKRLLELETHRDRWTVHVRPELVVEVAFDGIQRSSRYPGGMALRFARVLRYREDKPAAEADTVQTVRDLHTGSVTNDAETQ
ncbi:ATP-dependent DNA ligase [Actinopolymorpha singaporensis]|uniref:Probable DNA ligase n=1 Tax=Actinopolymorpha singaporensis TaxID=117157 RepID=A0A1H1WD13_9ACTN|nr:ATP-dependent DNA ligase [Actinopolymorpha singaporensis]SDS94882.1 DNA ligase-1 [Actinopolymorpha singaporensis]